MADNVFERVDDPADPCRCQANIASGQCPFKGKIMNDGKRGKYCPRHVGANIENATSIGMSASDPLRNYRFSAIFQSDIDAKSNSEKIKSLREEIGLCRLVLEAIVNRCQDTYDLTMEADRIMRMTAELNKLVQSCHKIEESTGQLLDKSVVINIGTMMVGILEKYVPDKSILDVVGTEIYEAIAKSASGTLEDRP